MKKANEISKASQAVAAARTELLTAMQRSYRHANDEARKWNALACFQIQLIGMADNNAPALSLPSNCIPYMKEVKELLAKFGFKLVDDPIYRNDYKVVLDIQLKPGELFPATLFATQPILTEPAPCQPKPPTLSELAMRAMTPEELGRRQGACK